MIGWVLIRNLRSSMEGSWASSPSASVNEPLAFAITIGDGTEPYGFPRVMTPVAEFFGRRKKPLKVALMERGFQTQQKSRMLPFLCNNHQNKLHNSEALQW